MLGSHPNSANTSMNVKKFLTFYFGPKVWMLADEVIYLIVQNNVQKRS